MYLLPKLSRNHTAKILRQKIANKSNSQAKNDKLDEKVLRLKLQRRGNPSKLLPNKMQSITNAQIEFTIRKLKAHLLSLMASFLRELKSSLVYKLFFCGCNSTYGPQTVRHLASWLTNCSTARRIQEHKKKGHDCRHPHVSAWRGSNHCTIELRNKKSTQWNSKHSENFLSIQFIQIN